MVKPAQCIGGICCLAVIITVIVVLSLSFSSLEQLDYGLNYNAITLQIEDTVYSSAGLYFLGVGHYFIKFPRVIQTIEFVAEENDRLQTRTSDGLPVSLSISFQYRYDSAKLRDLYLAFKQQELEVYENTAKAVIANVATNFSAYTFFNDKQGIATEMQLRLTEVFFEQLYAQIDAFQITRVELPSEFQNAILSSIEAKQNITRTERYKDNMLVTFSTQVTRGGSSGSSGSRSPSPSHGAAHRRTQLAATLASSIRSHDTHALLSPHSPLLTLSSYHALLSPHSPLLTLSSPHVQLLVANQTARQTIALARGTANQRAQQAEAIAAVTEQTVSQGGGGP